MEESGKMKNLDAEKEGFLLLRTRNIAAGIGCRKGISEEVLEQGLKEVLKEYGLEMEQLCGLASIDLKKEEAGLMQLSEKYKIPFVTYNADELMKIRSVSDSSDFVKKVTGVDNVCERAVRTYVPDLSKIQKRKNDSCTGGRTSQNPFLKEERKRKMREKERKLLLFAGTTEGRMLAEYLSKKRIACYVSTATEYGKSLLQEEQLSDIIILAGRMNEEEIKTFLTEKKIECVVDATHPFAKIVTENIVNACKETQTGYIRCLRETETSGEDLAGQEQVRVFESVRAAAEFLRTTEGNILITTGSKELKEYTKIGNYQERCFARVLSTKAAVEESVRLGFEGKHLIAMQGPFSEEMNLALLHQTRARYFVTKESGKAGGFEEKLKAAKKAGAVLIVIGRPQERGRSVQEVCHFIESNFGKKEQE